MTSRSRFAPAAALLVTALLVPSSLRAQPAPATPGKPVKGAFGIDTAPVARVSVLNGSGAPGVGEEAAKMMIPAGYRIVSSQNAQKFGHPTTQVIAQGEQARSLAEQLHSLLGVGRVIVVAQRSGFADITLLVGEDFKPT